MTEPLTTPAPAAPAAATKKPSSPAYGLLICTLLWVMASWLLSYTLLDFGWQQAMGSWNYLITLGWVALLAALMKRWHPDMRR